MCGGLKYKIFFESSGQIPLDGTVQQQMASPSNQSCDWSLVDEVAAPGNQTANCTGSLH